MQMAVLLILAGVVYTVLGDYFLKLSSGEDQPFYSSAYFYLGAALYGFSAIFAVLSMKLLGLAAIGVFYSIFTVLLLAFMGVFMFNEKLVLREILGVAFAIVSLFLMSRIA